ncbi:MAG: tetratricopeptide repeat protein [Dysgonamonadaceae bacterium]|jgi:tetratricopeptide (TPR) repeat protein|nr:tetratricopeptide repeat protein [Dysgonamonadaceae bacterium]
MQAKEIIGLMKGESAYTADMLLNLKNVLEEYPYFQAVQLLYTLNLQATKDSRFNAELRKAACYSGDRRNLFYRVKSDSFPPEWIEKLEKKEQSAETSSFDLVDFFLAGQKGKEKKTALPPVSPQMVSTDYLSYTLSETSAPPQTEAIPLQHQDTIDKFLAKTEKSPVKIVLKNDGQEESGETPFSDLDTVEEGSFFSETLAKIYLKQKKYEKALEIIRKLYLLYPEKNRYFADQIRFLEKLINNTKK